ncbi:nuclear transport factor 2 family protein [Cellulomonas sp. S1-8]|uniref:nuclear transport factor 2 family protein n=1 Tax=Cellulomonas sp. S1-8 TaxID=2904790 RepID=UPI0022434D9A|nr:nuclear transport factor 2 family protein [Cellulomonas sp. S1-8]UZN02038.1 nuclear transport factor 2 family protein [Cellulomonas sp. S1-8]
MPTTVTDPTVAAFVAATNAADAPALEALFAEDAVVTDNGVEFTDPRAIAAWIAHDVVGSRITFDPVTCTDGATPVLVTDADGDFPGGVRGPIRFELRFAPRGGRIARLDIRPLR